MLSSGYNSTTLCARVRAAPYGREEQQADISVSIRGANTLKLTFLQIKDVTEFGDVVEAAPLFLPPGEEEGTRENNMWRR